MKVDPNAGSVPLRSGTKDIMMAVDALQSDDDRRRGSYAFE